MRYTVNLTMWDTKNPDDKDLLREETVLEADSEEEINRLFNEACKVVVAWQKVQAIVAAWQKEQRR
ncbi:hypothetical protein LCGC14_2385990 [marine sediment metagenome]|uniref:Uncharacterized protein n=1 Tax=marine sediment metagenome TaxID=412755 RepID=A0A0F9CLQ7_9ZZZZ